MKVKDLNDILTKLVENGFGDNEVDSRDTEKKDNLCLCISGIFEEQFLKVFPELPLKNSKVHFTGFSGCEKEYCVKETAITTEKNNFIITLSLPD